MARRIWIIAEGKTVTAKVKADAKLNNCPEIAVGVPPIFEGQVGALPCVYEEPDSLPPEPGMSTHLSQLVGIDVNAVRPATVKRIWEEREYFYDCFVTQTIKDMYAAGDIQLGDWVLVHFDDMGEQLVTEKIYKSW